MRGRWMWMIFILGTFSFVLPSDNNPYPQGYFRSPVEGLLRLSGTFGELRPNHFHSGLDIKGDLGHKIYAAAGGYVSRVKVEKSGYGKALYLTHSNGFTTVYGHLNDFTPQIEQYIKNQQYDRKKFELDLNPDPKRFVFRKGQQIGIMGNTGSSAGAHLHFEIRDTRTEKPINPLLFGLKVPDSRPPRMHQLRVYHLDDQGQPLEASTHDLVWKDDHYELKEGVLTVGAWRAGFGLKVYDHMDEVSNWNGVYSLQMLVDGEPAFDFEMETFGFGETRYLNAHLDYGEQVSRRGYFNRLFLLPGNRLSIYGKQVNRGMVKLYEGKTSKITLIAKDLAGNASRLKFGVKRGPVPKPPRRKFEFVLPYDEARVIDDHSIYLNFPAGTFYETLYMRYNVQEEVPDNVYSAVYTLHHPLTPVHHYFDIAIRPSRIPEALKSKAFIAYRGKSVVNCGGEWVDGRLKTEVRNLGDYCIMVDKVPPVVEPVIFNSDLRGYNRMTFRITDNYPSSGRAKGLTYRAVIDGKWALLEYDLKSDLLTYRFDGRLDPGQHKIRLDVSDSQKNIASFEGTFLR